MQMHKVHIKGIGNINICQSCIDGKHLSYGDHHKTGIEDSQDCKNVGEVDGVKVQCLCNFDWPEIIEAIKEKQMSKNKTAKEHAGFISAAFTHFDGGKDYFSELVEFMDGDRDNDLLQAMKEIDQKNFPEKYVSQDEKKKEV